jgi:hydroxymethylbilane synthase
LQTPTLRIGTRGSKLALAQAHQVRAELAAAHGLDEEALEIVTITTSGDRIANRPLAEVGGKGLFTKELEEALLAGAIDLAVHSMKDMPALLADAFTIAAFLPREDPRDAFLSPVAYTPRELPHGAIIGSSSVRRVAQLKRLRPDISAVNFRGNVDTRLRKLEAGDVQATFLACAGLNRLGLAAKITSPVPVEDMLPAVAQGAIGIEIRNGDDKTRTLLQPINHEPTAIAIACERAFLASLEGSCRTPIAGHAILDGSSLRFRGQTLTLDGSQCFEAARQGSPGDAARLGHEAGEEVKAQGGALIER